MDTLSHEVPEPETIIFVGFLEQICKKANKDAVPSKKAKFSGGFQTELAE